MAARSKAVWGVALAGVMLATAACGGGSGSGDSSDGLPKSIKVGVPLDLTGSAQITGVGTGEDAGIDAAIKEINSTKFLGSSKISKVGYDTKADKSQAVQRTTQLVSRDQVAAIVGFTLTPSFLAAGPIAQKAGIPVMAVGLSGAGITDVGDFIFRELLDYSILFDNNDPAFIKATGGKTAAYLYGSDTVTTSGQYKHRKALIEGLGIKTVESQSITASSTDMRAQLTAIKAAKPDYLVINVDTGQAPTVLTQVDAVGIDAQILSDNGLTAKATLDSAPAARAAQCGIFSVAWVPESDQGKNPDFVAAWKKDHDGAAPDMFNALGYDAMWSMATAIKDAGSTKGTAIRDALAKLSSFSGALGDYNWQKDNQPSYPGVAMQIQDGKAIPWTPTTTCTN